MRNSEQCEVRLAGETPRFTSQVNLVPFRTRKFKSPHIALVNKHLQVDGQNLLEDYAFGVARRSEKDLFKKEYKTFFAERYGSPSSMGHGGGGRVGADVSFQVKGIGITPVVCRRGVDFCYRNGEMLLAEAIRETIWGEVFDVALPYGATRSPCAISTGTLCALPPNDVTGVKLERGLHVRENAPRLAHFMRATYFKAQGAVQSSWPHDYERVSVAINEMSSYLPNESIDPVHLMDAEFLKRGLTTMAERLAAQLAAARARRLAHGALVSSNFCLDGRWIDYGSAHWSPVHATGKHFEASFWYDEKKTMTALSDFCWQLRRHGKCKDIPHDVEWLGDDFRTALDLRQKVEFLSLAGFSEEDLVQARGVNFAAGLALGKAIFTIARAGRTERFTGEDEALGGYGDYDVSTIMATLSVASDAVGADVMLRPLLENERLRVQLITAYTHFLRESLARVRHSGGDIELFRRSIITKMLNRSAHVGLLYGACLIDDINERLESTREKPNVRQAKMSALLDNVRSCAGVLLSGGVTNDARLWQGAGVDSRMRIPLANVPWSVQVHQLDAGVYPVLKDARLAEAIAGMRMEPG